MNLGDDAIAALDRDDIESAIRSAVEPLPYVLSLWEGGAAAWGRNDAWSDIDLHLLVEDGFTLQAIAVVDDTMNHLSPIEIRFAVPQPTWHGHEQVFYRLRDAGEFLLVDLAVMQRSSSNLFLERERHGIPKVLFDKTGEALPTSLDRVEHSQRVSERLRQLALTFPLFQSLVKKEVLRDNPIGAASFYYSLTLQPLMTLLRIRYCPDRFDFGARYASFDLPPEILRRVEPLWFVSSLEGVETQRGQAEALFFEILEAIRDEGIWED